MRKDVAENAVRALIEFSAPLNALTEISESLGDVSAAQQMRIHLAAIMMEVDKMLHPILLEFPELDPDRPQAVG